MSVQGLADRVRASVIIPTFNRAERIGYCLEALRKQNCALPFEVIVVNDGSTDETLAVLKSFPEVRVINQTNMGPAAARNRGVAAAVGEIVLFTDDDCEPFPEWLTEMLKPFEDPNVVGAKGVYRTRQSELIARFVQIEYQDRYRLMARQPEIDFIDTYSAAFRRDRFIESGGYDTSFPVACSEDSDLSYRMSARGWKMIFAPTAMVWHQHPTTLKNYLRRKVKFAFWRISAVKNNPSKMVRDSHTPQLMKLQMLLLPALAVCLLSAIAGLTSLLPAVVVAVAFLLSALPFSWRAVRTDYVVAALAPLILMMRGGAQFLGAVSGSLYVLRKSMAGLMASKTLP